MADDLLSANEAAQQLGISTTSLYAWLAQSDACALVIRGQKVAINYLQGGAKGQGRIKIEAKELDRIKDLMRVRPQPISRRQPPLKTDSFPGITVKLGRPGT